MKKALLSLTLLPLLVAEVASAASIWQREVLVLTTATTIARTAGSKGFEVQNLGPNPIFCTLNSDSSAVVNKSRRLAFGDTWSVDVPSTYKLACIAATASQLTGAATIITEVAP